MTCKKLEKLGYTVIEAKTGVEGVQMLKSREDVGLVLSDVVMPGGLSGFDVARWVASNRPGVKVILCSGYAAENWSEDTQHVAYEGAEVVVLPKPYTGDQLKQALNDALAPGETPNLKTMALGPFQDV